jgi:hypothetical protein
MTREEAEHEIRELLTTETRAVVLSNKLFTPDGLFNRIAHTEAERREVINTSLWRDAQARLRELEDREIATFSQATRGLLDGLLTAASKCKGNPDGPG